MLGDRQADKPQIVVIGAGAFGGWSALSLVRSDADVTLIDAWGPGNSRASSGGETRVIRTLYTDPLYVGMAARALALWREHQDRVGEALFVKTGLLLLAQAPGLAFLHEAAQALSAAGISCERLSPGEVSRRYRQIDVEGIEKALFEPDAGYLFARRACVSVVDAFVAAGGRYLKCAAQPDADDDETMQSIRLSDGTRLHGDVFVFACGPWLAGLFPDVLGSRLKITRQEVHFFGEPPGSEQPGHKPLPVWADVGERFWYGIPDVQGRGCKIADDTHGDTFDPTHDDRLATPQSVAAARQFAAGRFKNLRAAPLLESRVCQYSVTPQNHFIVDRHPRFGNVWLVGGGSGHGFKHGPVIGEHVAACILGSEASRHVFSLSPDGHRQ